MKINVHTSHPSAFISSTFVDLKMDRAEVAKVLSNRGLNVNALDIKPASSQTSKQEILKGIAESDFVVLIIGDRYGSILPSMTGSETLSITFWEYNNAIRMGKPVIAYFKSVIDTDPLCHDNKNDTDYVKKRKFFDRFKKAVTARHNPAYYASSDELAEKLDKSLISIYRSGVNKLLAVNANLNSKITELENEIAKLNAQSNLGLRSLLNDPQPNFLSLGINGLKGSSVSGNQSFGLSSLRIKK
ncbi:DUF4062 domain-containing protein [Aeromonas veronii]